MAKYLITGFSGFVSHHFLDYLNQLDLNDEVLGIDINEPNFTIESFEKLNISFLPLNLLEKQEIYEALEKFRPDYILHLASFSSVAYSWQNPVMSFVNNTNIFLNLVDQVRLLNIDCRILSIGSSEEYGNVNIGMLPLKENLYPDPLSPYAVARVSQEMLSKIYSSNYGLNIVLTRSFNHIGTGQRDNFVISSFVKKIANIRINNLNPEILTGDLSIIRDFLDVRDVVRAYYLLLHKGKKGEIYNVCSGNGVSLEKIIQKISEIAELKIITTVDPALVRPNDNKKIIGDNSKILNAVSWIPTITLEKSLNDIYKYWFDQLKQNTK